MYTFKSHVQEGHRGVDHYQSSQSYRGSQFKT